MDESGFPLNNLPGRIVAEKGKREVVKLTNVERGENVTAVVCCNATGIFIPPCVIFKGTRYRQLYRENLPMGSAFEMSDSGWINEEIFIQCLLILDCHNSHCSLAAIEYGRENGIEMLSLPLHSTHVLQPLDCSVLKPLKSFYNKEATLFIHNHPNSTINKNNFGKLFSAAWKKAVAVGIATKGFECTGIYSFKPRAISEDKFLPSLHYQDHSKSLPHPDPNLPSTSTPDKNELPTINKSPFSDSLPTPQKTQQSGCKRPPKRNSTHLTSDFYFQDVAAKRKLKLEKAGKGKSKCSTLKNKNILKSSSDEDDPLPLESTVDEEEEDVPYSFCDLRYLSEKSVNMGEWLRCQKCLKWFHKVCVGAYGKKRFMCGKWL